MLDWGLYSSGASTVPKRGTHRQTASVYENRRIAQTVVSSAADAVNITEYAAQPYSRGDIVVSSRGCRRDTDWQAL